MADNGNKLQNGDSPGIEKKFTEAEKSLERHRRTIGLFLGPAVAAAIFVLPLKGLSPDAHSLAAIISWVVIWWVSEAIPIPATAVLGAALSVIAGVADARTVFAPFADPIIFLFMGSFLIARAMSVHGLDRRFAFGLLSLRVIGNSASRIFFIFGAVCALLSMWISNTATTAMMFPIGVGIISAMAEMMARQTGREVQVERLRFTTGMMLMAAYASSTGGIGTPVGTPPNLIGLAMLDKFAGVRIPFFQWMLFAIPLLMINYFVLFFIMVRLHKPEVRRIQGSRESVKCERARLGPWTLGQKNTLFAFLVAVVLWIMPGFLTLLGGQDSPLTRGYSSRVPEAVAAVLAALLLFVLPVDWKKRE
ncbi:MAG: anion transporter, partial [Candidatus Aminicenantes bacterium]|nr:anion transporter [Candidatus Aminicenantes bacterium]